MTKQDVYEFFTKAGFFHLATINENKPKVRGMMLYKADKDGIIFHTGAFKDVYGQILQNPEVELCANDLQNGVQVRVSGKLEIIGDNDLKEEISSHPSRQFLQGWKNSVSREDFYKSFIVFKLKGGKAVMWTMATNMEPKTIIELD